jgi:hypothetical protein
MYNYRPYKGTRTRMKQHIIIALLILVLILLIMFAAYLILQDYLVFDAGGSGLICPF